MPIPDYLQDLPIDYQERTKKRLLEITNLLNQPQKGIIRFDALFRSVSHLRASYVDTSSDVVRIGTANELAAADQAKVRQVLEGFMPWRKGPYEIFGIPIDAEWRSERKWQRVEPVLPDLSGKVIADIGCNNGYYMFRMARHKPRLVIGFEPYLQHYFTFKTLNTFAGLEQLHVELLGVEDIGLFAGFFDIIFLMGIIYHRISPLEVLREVRKALRPGGLLIVESQGIPGDEPVALFPANRYAKVPGTYFVPTASCLANWLTRSGFTDVNLFCSHPMSNQEQSRTDWMTFESYEDFLNPADKSRTVEGYPAPIRIYLRAKNPD